MSPTTPTTSTTTPISKTARRRPRPRFVDPAVLGAMLDARRPAATATRKPATLRRVEDELLGVRANVKDAAEVVLAFLARTLDGRDGDDLTAVLRRVLRPSPDCRDVSYAALAKEVNAAMGTGLSPKRVQTAVRHLRLAHRKRHQQRLAEQAARHASRRPDAVLSLKLDALRAELADLTTSTGQPGRIDGTTPDDAARRKLATLTLSAVRGAAGRVIEAGFGEHLPEHLDADVAALADDYRAFLRERVCDTREPTDGHADLLALRQALARFDGSAEHCVRLVLAGSTVVQRLLGRDSLPGLLAQLNVRVVGRALIDTPLYVAEMLRLAEQADALHDDAATQRYLRFARRLPEDQRVPAARRVASYARSNAATRILDRVVTHDLDADAVAVCPPTLRRALGPSPTWLAVADHTVTRMLERDSGFTLTMTAQLALVSVQACRGDRAPLEALLPRLGESGTVERLALLTKFDNCRPLIDTARRAAATVYPAITTRCFVA